MPSYSDKSVNTAGASADSEKAGLGLASRKQNWGASAKDTFGRGIVSVHFLFIPPPLPHAPPTHIIPPPRP
eukprot:9274730-Pyramimonas_sp.AAC.1